MGQLFDTDECRKRKENFFNLNLKKAGSEFQVKMRQRTLNEEWKNPEHLKDV